MEFGNRVNLAEVRAAEITTGGRALTAFGEFEPRWDTLPFDDALLAELGPDFDPQQRPLAGPPSTVQVRSASVRSSAWDLELTATQPETVTLYLHYYPRWQATLDGEPVALGYQEGRGLVQVQIPAGEHRLALRYGSTAAEQAGLLVSGLTALGLLTLGAWALWRRNKAAPGFDGTLSVAAVIEPAPPIWLLAALSLFLLVKFAYIDPQTTIFRCASTAGQVCGAQATVDVPLVGGPALRGYSVSAYELAQGDELRVTVYWQGVAEQLPRLHSFVHVRNQRPDDPLNPRSGDGIWAQQENYAPGGRLTSQYQPGKLYVDEFRVRLPEDMPPGEYFLEIGLFDPQTGEQLDPVADLVEPPLEHTLALSAAAQRHCRVAIKTGRLPRLRRSGPLGVCLPRVSEPASRTGFAVAA